MLKKRTYLLIVLTLLLIDVSAYCQKLVFRCSDTSEIMSACRKRVMRRADSGYPFATITIDSASFVGRRRVDVYCDEQLMQRYHVENVFLIGCSGLNPDYVYSSTGIAPGSVYNESRIRMAAQRIAASSAAISLQPAEVEFHPGGLSDVYLYLNSRRSNSLGASIALCRDAGDGKYFVAGNALADLGNNFGYGERFYFAWNGYSRRSQMLDIKIKWPYIFHTPITPDIAINIIKADTLSLTAQINSALSYALSPDLDIKAVLDVRKLVSIKDNNMANNDDVRTALYGIGFRCRKNTPNNSLINIECTATGGTRSEDGSNGSVAEISSAIEYRWPLRKMARYEGRLMARQMYSAQKTYIHECIPIGGVGSLRGFEDNELRATGFVSLCNTIRLLLPEGFSVQLFYDQAFYKCNAEQIAIRKDNPSGFGAGVGIKAGAASIDIGWAIGREHGEIRPLKDAKTLIFMRLDF